MNNNTNQNLFDPMGNNKENIAEKENLSSVSTSSDSSTNDNINSPIPVVEKEVSNQLSDNTVQPANSTNFSSNTPNTNNNNKVLLIVLISLVGVLILAFLTYVVTTNLTAIKDKTENTDITNNDNNNNPDNEPEYNNNVKGDYTSEHFSGNTFTDGNTTYTFNTNSTFEVKYDSGEVYKGTYELYQGLFISLKADEIKEDDNILHNVELSEDIIKKSEALMDSPDDILNTYFIFMTTDDDVFQPFLINYDEEADEGLIINLYAQSQSSFAKK